MKGYLQRLAQRAEGVSLSPSSPSLAPARHNLMTREATPDSLAQGEQSMSFVRPARTPAVLHDSKEYLSPEKDQASTMIRDRRHIGRAETVVIENMSVPSETNLTAHTRPQIIEPPTRSETPSRVSKNTDFRKANVENLENGPDEKARSAKPRAQELIEPFATERPTSETSLLETHAPVVATSKLEPRPDDTLRSEPLSSEEPRLVIGQLRVDVVPATPTQAREVVRTVTRTVGPNQGNTVSLPTSRLRFGLGQM